MTGNGDDDFAARLDRLLAAITKSHEAMITALHVVQADMRLLDRRVAKLEQRSEHQGGVMTQ